VSFLRALEFETIKGGKQLFILIILAVAFKKRS
jgi:hypothetical protein